MNCRETERLLDTFFDGELDGRLMRDAALHVTRCPTCEQEVQRRETIHELLVQSISRDLGSEHLDIWSSIETKLTRSPEEPVISGQRLAAARSSLRGVLVGTRAGRRSGPSDSGDAADTAWTRSSPRRRRGIPLPAAVVSALAASILVVLLLAGQGGDDKQTLATAGQPSAGVAKVASLEPAAPHSPGSSFEQVAARSGAGAETGSRGPGQRPAPRQVQIDALEYTGGPMALWREPASETTIIWIGDSDPRRPNR